MKEKNEISMESILKEVDMWQEGKSKDRVAFVVMQDESGKAVISGFCNGRCKSPELYLMGRMIGMAEHNKVLYNFWWNVIRFATKLKNKEAKKHAANQQRTSSSESE